MKNLAFAIAFALLALTIPASAAEVPEAALAMEIFQLPQTEEPVAATPLKIKLPCSFIEGTSCPYAGNTQTCYDVCGYSVSCTCTASSPNPNYRFWRCGWQC